MKKEPDIAVSALNLQTFRTLSTEGRAKMVKDWIKNASEVELSETDKDIPPNERIRS